MGLRDANELTWNEVLDLVEPMVDFIDTPILLDADSGYGDFNIFTRFVKKAEARGIAGVCIEDKEFPKRNSFADTSHALANIEEFTAKIRAAKDAQSDPDFCLVARTEALVAGAGMDEALERADRYQQAGADALFVHSKQSTASEIQEFTQKWQGSIPLVIAPTTYSSTPTEEFEAMGISSVIWANHGLRAAVQSMAQLYQNIHERRSVEGLEASIASVEDLLSLTKTEELLETEQKYTSQKPGTP
jgi:phosphoenolpyruvate phosphomutase